MRCRKNMILFGQLDAPHYHSSIYIVILSYTIYTYIYFHISYKYIYLYAYTVPISSSSVYLCACVRYVPFQSFRWINNFFPWKSPGDLERRYFFSHSANHRMFLSHLAMQYTRTLFVGLHSFALPCIASIKTAQQLTMPRTKKRWIVCHKTHEHTNSKW